MSPGLAARCAAGAFGATMNLLELPMRAAPALLGNRLAWLFVAPNLIVFGLFTFLPIILDIWYAFTGSTNLLPGERPFVGLGNSDEALAQGQERFASGARLDWRLR